MRDERVIYVAGHPLMNRRCARLPPPKLPKLCQFGWELRLCSNGHGRPNVCDPPKRVGAGCRGNECPDTQSTSKPQWILTWDQE